MVAIVNGIAGYLGIDGANEGGLESPSEGMGTPARRCNIVGVDTVNHSKKYSSPLDTVPKKWDAHIYHSAGRGRCERYRDSARH